MSIISSEVKFYKSAVVNDTSTNGGRMSTNALVSGVLQNVFPHVLSAERTAGSTKYRKIFIKVANDDDFSYIAPQIWFDNETPGDDWAVLFAATQVDTQTDITGSERIYGSAGLKSDASAAGSTIVVDVEDASLTGIFQASDDIRITDMVDPDSVTGNEEFHVINGAPSVSGTEVTITTTSPLANTYTVAGGARVMSILEPGDIETSFSGWTETTASGTYDETSFPVVGDNIGTIYQTWTLTFTDATNFTVAGDTIGSVTSGSTASDYSPNNPDFTKPYFTLESGGWGGTWASGDTIEFLTVPASTAVWEKRVVPAGASSLSANKIVLVAYGETV